MCEQRLLSAIAARNPDIGYCQSLNFLAGMLLMMTREEEMAFWIVDVVVNELMAPDYYTYVTALGHEAGEASMQRSTGRVWLGCSWLAS